MTDIRVGHGKYRLQKKCGGGAFGEIFIGINMKNGEEVAVKLEWGKTKYPQLLYEAQLFHLMKGENGVP